MISSEGIYRPAQFVRVRRNSWAVATSLATSTRRWRLGLARPALLPPCEHRRGIMDFVSTTSPPYPPPTPGGGYALRAVVVADSLDDLHGPAHGEVRLPLHLDASARQMYDLDQDYFRRLVYRLVLLEAATEKDLVTWLDRDTLVRNWPELNLPPVVRAAWEGRHPELRQRGAGPRGPRP